MLMPPQHARYAVFKAMGVTTNGDKKPFKQEATPFSGRIEQYNEGADEGILTPVPKEEEYVFSHELMSTTDAP